MNILEKSYTMFSYSSLILLKSKDPVAGLMPDTVSVLYFVENPKDNKDSKVTSLRGIVRFGAQATPGHGTRSM